MFKKRFVFDRKNNIVVVDKSVQAFGRIDGRNNIVSIKKAARTSRVTIQISGNDNRIEIGELSQLKNISIIIGSNVPANGCRLTIGENFTCENGCKILMYNSENVCQIGDACMFSKNVQIRCGEMPHLIFDKTTGEYLDVSEGVFIGNHVWIGEDAYITKRVTVPSECVIGAKSVVTKRFDQENAVIAGNPARVVRADVQWIRNMTVIDKDSVYYEKLQAKDKR